VERPLPPPPPGATIAPLAAEVKRADERDRNPDGSRPGRAFRGSSGTTPDWSREPTGASILARRTGSEPSRAGPRRWRRARTRWPGSHGDCLRGQGNHSQ